MAIFYNPLPPPNCRVTTFHLTAQNPLSFAHFYFKLPLPPYYKPLYRFKDMSPASHLLDTHSDFGIGNLPNSLACLPPSLSQQGAREESVHLVRHFYKVSCQSAGEGSAACVTDTGL